MAEPKIRLALNGFGRIGRAILRLVATGRANEGFEIVVINDIADLDICAYLFKYDSVYGPFPGSIDETAGTLIVNGQPIPFHQQRDISTLDLGGVDLVLECTGAVIDVKSARAGLDAGAGAVLISGPSGMADATIVLGANEHLLNGQKIVSNASCTTNALGPLLKVLDDAFGVESGHMTTVHCYTGSQPTIDKPRDNFARSRAAALSMVPTTTSASHLLGEVLPALKGRIEGRAIRVPTASVSAIDLTVQTRETVSVALVNELLSASAAASPLLGWITEPLVSTDLRGRPESLIISARETSVSVGGLLRVFGWYDNEWGFSNRMLDMAHLMAKRTTTIK